MTTKTWRVYLSGEIHSDWREQIQQGISEKKINALCDSAVTDHQKSDDVGVNILGAEQNTFWHDNKGAKINAMRTRNLIQQADIVVVRFGPQYKQWNAAFDAGMASALGKSLITLHNSDINHALKEVDAAANAVCETPAQVVQILDYIIE